MIRLNEQQQRRWHELQTFVCTVGSHTLQKAGEEPLDRGACAMELAAYVAGEDWSDSPDCVDPALSSAVRRANDAGPQWVRDALRDRIPQLIGTRLDRKAMVARAHIFAWCAIKEIAPYWLDMAGLNHHAAALRSCNGTFGEAREVARRARADAADADAADAYAAYAAAAADAAAADAAYAAYAAAAAADADAAYAAAATADAAAAYAAAAAADADAAAADAAAADADADAAYAAYAAYAAAAAAYAAAAAGGADVAAATADAAAAFIAKHSRPGWEMFIVALDRAIAWAP